MFWCEPVIDILMHYALLQESMNASIKTVAMIRKSDAKTRKIMQGIQFMHGMTVIHLKWNKTRNNNNGKINDNEIGLLDGTDQANAEFHLNAQKIVHDFIQFEQSHDAAGQKVDEAAQSDLTLFVEVIGGHRIEEWEQSGKQIDQDKTVSTLNDGKY